MSGYWVSARSVVHLADGNCVGKFRYPWNPERRLSFDKACRNCLRELPAHRAADPRPTDQIEEGER